MGKKRPSLNKQLNDKLQSLLRIGESRHIAKKEYRDYCIKNNIHYVNGQAQGIFSWNTYNSYKQTLMEFTLWLKERYPNIKYIKDISKDICTEYLLFRKSNNMSAWTIDKDKAALNKIFNYGLNKKEIGLPIRSKKNIKRSRLEATTDKHYNPLNYKYQILIAKSTGCRRESVLKIKKEDFIYNNGLPIALYLKEKGGKERYAIILKKNREEIHSFLNGLTIADNEPIFKKYPLIIDNHAFRSYYANALYKQFLNEGVDKNEEDLLNHKFTKIR